LSARHSAEGLHRRPVRAASPSASSASVAGVAALREGALERRPRLAAAEQRPPAPGGLGGAPALLAGLPQPVVQRRHAHREAPGDLGPAPLAPLASDQRPLA
jgi:hypothetical protein